MNIPINEPKPRLDISRDGARIIALALKKAVNDELFDGHDETEAVRYALAFKTLSVAPRF